MNYAANCTCLYPAMDREGFCTRCFSRSRTYERIVYEAADSGMEYYKKFRNSYLCWNDGRKLREEMIAAMRSTLVEKDSCDLTVEQLVAGARFASNKAIQSWEKRRDPLLKDFAAPAAKRAISDHYCRRTEDECHMVNIGKPNCDCGQGSFWPPPNLADKIQEAIVSLLDTETGSTLTEKAKMIVANQMAEKMVHEQIEQDSG